MDDAIVVIPTDCHFAMFYGSPLELHNFLSNSFYWIATMKNSPVINISKFTSIFRHKKHELLSVIDVVNTLTAQVGSHVFCAYVVGGEEQSDYILCQSTSNSSRIMVFEKDSIRTGEIYSVLYNFKETVIWHRTIDDGLYRELMADFRTNEFNRSEFARIMVSGSLDQFWLGTGLSPEFIKINTRQSAMSILNGCIGIMRFCKPLIMFHTDKYGTEYRRDLYKYLIDVEYQSIDAETYEYLSTIESFAAKNRSVIAIHESLSARWRFTRNKVDFAIHADSLISVNGQALGSFLLKPGRYIVSFRLQSVVVDYVELSINVNESELLRTVANVRRSSEGENLILSLNVHSHINLINFVFIDYIEVLDVDIYSLEFQYSAETLL